VGPALLLLVVVVLLEIQDSDSKRNKCSVYKKRLTTCYKQVKALKNPPGRCKINKKWYNPGALTYSRYTENGCNINVCRNGKVFKRTICREPKKPNPVCGRPQSSDEQGVLYTFDPTRIVGGDVVRGNPYPWQAGMLGRRGGIISTSVGCGGALITSRYILTAAHCVKYRNGYEVKPEEIAFIIGNHNLSIPSDATYDDKDIYKVSSIVFHEDYRPQNSYHDIALIKLVRPSKASVVCLPDASDMFSGYNGVVTGWGDQKFNGSGSTVLRQVTLPILAQATCNDYILTTGQENTKDEIICAGFPQGGKDSCQGDSGGPFHVRKTSSSPWIMAGVVSGGHGCAFPNHPGLYTNVAKYLPWIKQNMDN